MTTPNNAAALEPCPFCGRSAAIKERFSVDHISAYDAMQAGMGQSATSITHHWFEVECGGCRAVIGGFDAEKAWTKWNRRATPAQPDALTSQPSQWGTVPMSSMNTPNNAAALERLEQKWRESAETERDYYSDALVACANELATLRATLAQPDALTVRIAHKGPADFPNHQCPAESSAVWNACCMEHERVLAGEVPMLTTTALTSQPSGGGEPIGYVDRNDLARLHAYKATIWPGTNEIDAVPVYTHPSADAPGVAVDDEMVERALAAFHAEVILMRNPDSWRKVMRAALTAALAPKPEGEL